MGLMCPREISFQGMYNHSYSEQGDFIGGAKRPGIEPQFCHFQLLQPGADDFVPLSSATSCLSGDAKCMPCGI